MNDANSIAAIFELFELDVRDRAAFERVADEAEQRLGPVSVLCNNAGIRVRDPLPELSYELWDLVMGVNLEGVYNPVSGRRHDLVEVISSGPKAAAPAEAARTRLLNQVTFVANRVA